RPPHRSAPAPPQICAPARRWPLADAYATAPARRPPALLRRGHRAEPIDAQVGGVAAVGGGVALLLGHRALRRRGRADQRIALALPRGRAEAVAALIAALALLAVHAAGIEHPEAARIAGEQLLRRQVERGVARIGARRRGEIDRRHPKLLGGDVVDQVHPTRIAAER